jgi:DNA-binding MarR family transcriptional regulator
MRARRAVSPKEYEALAAFRHALARFLGFSEAAAAEAGLTPRQYQALLALKGYGGTLTVGDLAERLQIHHHSAVGLVDRLEAMGLARRTTDAGDRRRVHVAPTAKGAHRAARLAAVHRDEAPPPRRGRTRG